MGNEQDFTSTIVTLLSCGFVVLVIGVISNAVWVKEQRDLHKIRVSMLDDKFMTFEEWRNLSAESRSKINIFVYRYDELRHDVQSYETTLLVAKRKVDALEFENKQLKGALTWYADDKNYSYNVPGKKAPSSVWIGDMGERARMALKGGEG